MAESQEQLDLENRANFGDDPNYNPDRRELFVKSLMVNTTENQKGEPQHNYFARFGVRGDVERQAYEAGNDAIANASVDEDGNEYDNHYQQISEKAANQLYEANGIDNPMNDPQTAQKIDDYQKVSHTNMVQLATPEANLAINAPVIANVKTNGQPAKQTDGQDATRIDDTQLSTPCASPRGYAFDYHKDEVPAEHLNESQLEHQRFAKYSDDYAQQNYNNKDMSNYDPDITPHTKDFKAHTNDGPEL